MRRNVLKCLLVVGVLYAALSTEASGNNVTVVHSFSGADGAFPEAALIADSAGNLYGTTTELGANGKGTLFKLALDGSATVLHDFDAENYQPYGRLYLDGAGNLFGTTYYGGNICDNGLTCGAVFKLAPDGTYTVLHAFNGGDDGAFPRSGFVSDEAGNLYGTTEEGGGFGASLCGDIGCGTIYRLAPDGTETVLYRFAGADGANPAGDLTLDARGNLYGTTRAGGNLGQVCPFEPNGCGVVFKLSKHRKETVLHSFCSQSDCADGQDPSANIIFDGEGNLYGTTFGGGRTQYCVGCGLVFRLSASGTETIIRNFCLEYKCRDGISSRTGVILDDEGTLYGTTRYPGNVFKLASDGKYSVLGNFHCGHDSCGSETDGDLVAGSNFDTLYGVSFFGGSDKKGVVFSVSTSHRK